MCKFRYPWIDESSTTLAACPHARLEHTTLNINVIFILRYVNWKQMEILFSLRPEGRENKLPFLLLANTERKSLSRAGVIALCASSACFLLLCHLYLHFYYLCIIVRKCQPAHVSMCPLRVSSGISIPSPWPGSVSTAALTSLAFCPTSICMRAGTQAHLGQSTCVTSGFPSTIFSSLLATYCRSRGYCQPLWPRMSFPLQLVWCQGKIFTHIMMSENILAFLGGLIDSFVHSTNLLGRLCRQ